MVSENSKCTAKKCAESTAALYRKKILIKSKRKHGIQQLAISPFAYSDSTSLIKKIYIFGFYIKVSPYPS